MVSKAVLLAASDRVPIANRTLLSHAAHALDGAGVRQLALVAPPGQSAELIDEIAADGPDALEVQAFGSPLSDSLGELEGFLGEDPFVVHLGDSLSKGVLGHALSSARTGAMDATVLVQQPSTEAGDHVVDLLGGHLDGMAPAGVYVFGRLDAPALRALDPELGGEAALIAAAQRMAELGGNLDMYAVGEWWRYRHRRDVLLEANRFALEGLAADFADAQVVGSDIQGGVVVHPTARIESSVVRGPAIIGEGAQLRQAYVGPYTSLGAHVMLEGAELENSIVLPEASITHLGGRLEASVVGSRARISRDFRLPRALRLTIGEGAEVSLA